MRKKPLRRVSKSPRRQHMEYLDYLWGTIVIIRDGRRCIICGSVKLLAGHHVYSKSQHSNVRYDTQDGVCLCFHHHQKHHWNTRSLQEAFDKHLIKTYGEMSHIDLQTRAEMRGNLKTRDLILHELVLTSELGRTMTKDGRFMEDDWSQLNYKEKKYYLQLYRRAHGKSTSDGSGGKGKVQGLPEA